MANIPCPWTQKSPSKYHFCEVLQYKGPESQDPSHQQIRLINDTRHKAEIFNEFRRMEWA